MQFILRILALAALSRAGATPVNQAPRVQITDGTVIGVTNNSIDIFQGIPYADPPVGDLRFKPPRPLSSPFGFLNATATPASCIPHLSVTDPKIFNQLPSEVSGPVSGFFHIPTLVSEDCLNLAVQRPSSTKPHAKLPVVVWIYGGAFETGSYEDYDYSSMITKSVALGHPIIVVRMQYRIGAWGFLSGKELQEEGSTNVGLKDQRLALQWVADNIAAFGGDPDKVTVWGESAGSMSIFDQEIAYSGDNTYRGRKLFRGAIMNSGWSMPAQSVDSPTAQQMYDSLAAATGCDKDTHGSLSCLRQVPHEKLYNSTAAISGIFGPKGLRLNFVPRPDPKDGFYSASAVDSLKKKKIAPISILSGTQDDEGSIFALPMLNSTNTTTLINGLHDLWPATSIEIIKSIVDLYPDEPSLGSPFGTGDANQLYPGFKRNAALVTDVGFHFQKRAFHQAVEGKVKIWNYNSKYNKAIPYLGTYHGSDVALMRSEQPSVPYDAIVQYYISFINFLDPNKLGHITKGVDLLDWPQWDSKSKKMVEFSDNTTVVVTDDARQKAFEYFVKIQDKLLY